MCLPNELYLIGFLMYRYFLFQSGFDNFFLCENTPKNITSLSLFPYSKPDLLPIHLVIPFQKDQDCSVSSSLRVLIRCLHSLNMFLCYNSKFEITILFTLVIVAKLKKSLTRCLQQKNKKVFMK